MVTWATLAGEGGGIGGVTGGGVPLGGLTLDPLVRSSHAGDEDVSGGGGPGGSGGALSRLYPCPDCEKVFRHPRSYYQHQHVHRGTHSCPGCHKLFSRRWDLLRHLNKNKYGCPARWREASAAGRQGHPPYHNSLSLSALASAAAVAASTSSQGDPSAPPGEPPDPQQLQQGSGEPAAVHLATPGSGPWTLGATVATTTRRRSSSSSGGREPRPPDHTTTTTTP